MKLANIYTTYGGVLKGQAAVGTSDVNCIDVKVVSGDSVKDVKQIVYSDALSVPTVITRRLTGSLVADYKYIQARATSASTTTKLNSALNVRSAYLFAGGIDCYVKAAGGDAHELAWISNSADTARWLVSVNSSNRVSLLTRFDGNSSEGFGHILPNDGEFHHLEVRGSAALPSDNACYYTAASRAAYQLDGGGWKYFMTDADGTTPQLFQSFYGQSVTVRFCSSTLEVKGTVVLYGGDGSTSLVTDAINIENAAAGATSLTGTLGLTYNLAAAVQQHYTDTFQWVE